MLKTSHSTLVLFSLSIALVYSSAVHSAWHDKVLEKAETYINNNENKEGSSGAVSKSISGLSDTDISSGLKQALDSGIKKAVEVLGKKDGFLGDQAVKILMPEKLQKVDKLLRSFGQDKIADDFILSMNRAAENAAPHVTDIFANSIKKMTITDAQSILTGSENAATEYFKKTTSAELSELIKPYVKESMGKADVTKYYESMLGMAKEYDSLGLLKSYLGADTGNLENYVTDKTMSGLFTKIAIQEKAIRNNPALRSTDILKKVFQ